MNKIFKAFCLAIILSVGVFAQTNNDEYKRNEFYGGFSNHQLNEYSRESLNGFQVSYVRNFHRYVGIKGDFSAAYKKDEITSPGFIAPNIISPSIRYKNKHSLYNVLGGVQIKDNASAARFKPFAHVLAGVAHSRYKTDNIVCLANCTNINTSDFSFSNTGFSAAVGGGLDIKINNRFDLRTFQVDYNPFRTSGQWSDNVRLGIGIVFK